MKLTLEEIKAEPEKHIKWMCYNILITTDKQALSLSFKPKKEMLVGGSYGYFVDGKFHSKKWISHNCVNVLGLIFND